MISLALLTVAWLCVLFGIARLTEKRAWLRRLSSHPLVFSLSLGVYATSWTFFGAVGLAHTQGFNFLAVSLGPLLSAALVPAVWLPLFRVLRRRRSPQWPICSPSASAVNTWGRQ